MIAHSVNTGVFSLLENLLSDNPDAPVKAVIEVEQRVPYFAREEVHYFSSKKGGIIKPHEKIDGSDPHYIVTPSLQVRTRDQNVNGIERRLTGTIKIPIRGCYEGVGSPPLFELTFGLTAEEHKRFASLETVTCVDVTREGEMLTYSSGNDVWTLEVSYDFVKNYGTKFWTEVSQDILLAPIKTRSDIAGSGIFTRSDPFLDEELVYGLIDKLGPGRSKIVYTDRMIKAFLTRELGFSPGELCDLTYAQMQVAQNNGHHYS